MPCCRDRRSCPSSLVCAIGTADRTYSVHRAWAISPPVRQRESFALRNDGIAVLTASQFESGAAASLLDEHMPEVMMTSMYRESDALDRARSGKMSAIKCK
jgi:hypothetical protein